MSQSTDTRAWRRTAAPRFNPSPAALAVVVGMALVLLTAAALLPSPSHVPRLTIENPTRYAITVETSTGRGDGWVAAAIVPPESTLDAREVVDMGGTWVMRFSGQSYRAEGETVTRADLETAGWHYSVPTSVGDDLADQGAPPTP